MERINARRLPIASAALSEADFAIDPDIRVAKTLPARVYSDPALFQRQRERVFARTWHYASHDDLVKVPGQVFPFTLLPGALDEPLLLTRDAADRLHCLSNVCTHRGNLVVAGAGHEPQLRCRYHGRRFTLDGRFLMTRGRRGHSTARNGVRYIKSLATFAHDSRYLVGEVNVLARLRVPPDEREGPVRKPLTDVELNEIWQAPPTSRGYPRLG